MPNPIATRLRNGSIAAIAGMRTEGSLMLIESSMTNCLSLQQSLNTETKSRAFVCSFHSAAVSKTMSIP